MDNLNEFLWTVVASSVGTTALLGTAAFLLRTQISHWLTKDLEALKARHQQELAAYKVSLISDEERLKALQSVKTAAALRSVERKFETFQALARSLQSHLSTIVGSLAIEYPNIDYRTSQVRVCQARVDAVDDALADAAPFLSEAQYLAVLHFNSGVNDLLVESAELPGLGPFPVDEARMNTLVAMQRGVSRSMHDLLGAMMQVD